MKEKIITVERRGEKVIYTGSSDRDTAHKHGICHLTVIVVPFIADGADKGKWIIHDRRDKQLAKGLPCPGCSFNLFGGHCNPPFSEAALIGEEIPEALLIDSALRELSEELYLSCDSGEALERFGKNETVLAKPYPLNENSLIGIGWTFFSDAADTECSFLYGLPVPSKDVESLIAADDYIKPDGTKGNIALPVFIKTERELLDIYRENNSDTEICNAITRLWDERNSAVYKKLSDTIQSRESISISDE